MRWKSVGEAPNGTARMKSGAGSNPRSPRSGRNCVTVTRKAMR
jgi:hypothetical protein